MVNPSNSDRIDNRPKNHIWSFEQALNYLASARKLGIRPGLERMNQLLKRLGNPQKAYPVIHVSGTNGKGSVSSMCAFIAAASGKRTGLFTSPYLVNFNERIRLINGLDGLEQLHSNPRSSEISDHNFAKMMMYIAYEVEVMKTKGYDMPTEFEMITAAAFTYLAEMKCDLIILETGMGGRLDSTNIINEKIATIITSLGYDHTERLGNSIQEIALEKAGIMRENTPTVLYNPHDTDLSEKDADAALEVIRGKAGQLNSPLTIVSKSDIEIVSSFVSGQSFIYKDKGPFHIQLGGDYQSVNAALAIEASRHITDQETIENGIAMARWPGRLECLSQSPLIILDGAHNAQGIVGLRNHLEKFLGKQKIMILFGVLKNKDYKKMLDLFLSSEIYDIAQIICTEANFHRAVPAEELAQEITEKLSKHQPKSKVTIKSAKKLEYDNITFYNDSEVLYTKDIKKATEYAYKHSVKNYLPLICFGSLYLIGDLKPILLNLLEGIFI